jgi:hypothetical protein
MRVAIPQPLHGPQLPSNPALCLGPPALLSMPASLATSRSPQPHIIPTFSSLPPPAAALRSSVSLSGALPATALSLCRLPHAPPRSRSASASLPPGRRIRDHTPPLSVNLGLALVALVLFSLLKNQSGTRSSPCSRTSREHAHLPSPSDGDR